jgi:streptogrisin C
MSSLSRVLVVGAAVAALTASGHQGAGAAPPRPATPAAEAAVLAAIKRDLGLDAARAEWLRGRQAAAIGTDRAARAALGAAYAGSWFDLATGALTVAVSDASRVADVVATGARARVVRYDLARLEAIKAGLDALAGRAPGAARTAAPGPDQVPDLAGWYVDPAANSVVVTVLKGVPPSAGTVALAQHGPAVRMLETDTLGQAAGDFMDGGDEINAASCSAGFNLWNPATGQGYLLTAGHCVDAGYPTMGKGPARFGPVLESWYPSYDDAIIRAENPGHWSQGPWVDTNPSDGGFAVVSGWSDAPVGMAVCKSGLTTRWTCGVTRAKDETVRYRGGITVYGMTRHTACVEPGDSGGPNVALLTMWSPEGVTSGSRHYREGGRWRCLTAVGAGENVSWYYPIADSLAHYGPLYGVTTY